jgi:adenylate cyclase class IV
MIEKIKNLNIGKVDYYTINGLGKYIELDIEVKNEEDIALRYF